MAGISLGIFKKIYIYREKDFFQVIFEKPRKSGPGYPNLCRNSKLDFVDSYGAKHARCGSLPTSAAVYEACPESKDTSRVDR